MKRYKLTITYYTRNHNLLMDEFECETMVDVSRVLLTYKPKQGAEISQYVIEEEGYLV